MYPAELLRRRYIEKLWRDTSIRHGFEEIDGPTFEHTGLYTAKSGEGIVSEIFGVFSGKDEAELASLKLTGAAPYALRPEFTPTLARMYAAKASSLPRPTRWFWQQNCYRAERPQRGRLREFGQWNLDAIGGDATPEGESGSDADVICACVDALAAAGLTSIDVKVRIGSRPLVAAVLAESGVKSGDIASAIQLIDQRSKLRPELFAECARAIGLGLHEFESTLQEVNKGLSVGFVRNTFGQAEGGRTDLQQQNGRLLLLLRNIASAREWCEFDLSIARGLAYYTGMVFEVHEASGAERAIAGGGRYDNLIETFGGPATPAVGFGMGDVVLGNILQDRGLMPEGKDLLAALSFPPAGLRPDVFVIANEKDESQAQLRPVVARLRRGVEAPAWLDRADRKPWHPDRYAVPPLHARLSSKATKNIGKLLQEAGASHARFAAIIETGSEATLKNLDTRDELKNVPLDQIGAAVARP